MAALRPDLSLHDLWDAEVYRSLPLVLRALTRLAIDDPDPPMMEGIAKARLTERTHDHPFAGGLASRAGAGEA